MSIVITLLTVVLVAVCFLMIFVVLMQRPRQEGLGAAFGSSMTDRMFGAQTTNVLQRATVWLAVMFFVLTLGIAMLMARQQGDTRVLEKGLSSGASTIQGTGEGAEGTPLPGSLESPLIDPSVTPTVPSAPEGTGPAEGASTEGVPAGEAGLETGEGTPAPVGEGEAETPGEASEAGTAEPTGEGNDAAEGGVEPPAGGEQPDSGDEQPASGDADSGDSGEEEPAVEENTDGNP